MVVNNIILHDNRINVTPRIQRISLIYFSLYINKSGKRKVEIIIKITGNYDVIDLIPCFLDTFYTTSKLITKLNKHHNVENICLILICGI